MRISGRLEFPGDKSISHRSLMLASLTNGNCIINNLSTGDDVESTRLCLVACGINTEKSKSTVQITGGSLSSPNHPLDCGNSGTTARLLSGLLAGQKITATLKGDSSLSRRPMNRIIHPLNLMGVDVKSRNGYLPIELAKSSLSGIEYVMPVASAQVKSSVLLAGLGAIGQTIVIETVKTRDHTEIMLKNCGTDILFEDNRIMLSPLKKPLEPFQLTVPGDPSTAAFYGAAAALIPNSELILTGVLANPTRNAFFQILEEMGTDVQGLNLYEECGELVNDLKIIPKSIEGISISGPRIPKIIDELPILAVLATQAEGSTTIRDAAELRVKECDRIKAICLNLRRMGANITELEDGFIIVGPTPLHATQIKTFNDHRIAMAFSIADLISDGTSTLDNRNCITVSFPEFENMLKKIVK